jgi:hypothetical protein
MVPLVTSLKNDLGECVFFHATVRPVVFLRDRPLNFANQPQATDAIRHDRQALAGLRVTFVEALISAVGAGMPKPHGMACPRCPSATPNP